MAVTQDFVDEPLETIFALATASGRAGVSVMRISGPHVPKIAQEMCGSDVAPRYAHLRTIRHPHTQEIIDTGLVLFFPAPASFTGENVLEFQIHGSIAGVDALSTALLSYEGVRLAQPGEFTRRAFDNEKMDLAEVEGLADLIEAQTQAQHQAAMLQYGGGLSEIYDKWRAELISCAAHVMAMLDFSDEDIEADTLLMPIKSRLKGVCDEMQTHLTQASRGLRLRHGVRVALVGAPNAGKSTFMNAVSGQDVSIVSDQPGTTRDIIESSVTLAGMPVILADMAGLRAETQDVIEQEGMRRAKAWGASADIVIEILNATDPTPIEEIMSLEAETCAFLQILNKVDEVSDAAREKLQAMYPTAHMLSLKTRIGFSLFMETLEGQVRTLLPARDHPVITRQRYVSEIEAAITALMQAQKATQEELMAEDIHRATSAIGALTGKVGVEDILDQVFQDFCLGK